MKTRYCLGVLYTDFGAYISVVGPYLLDYDDNIYLHTRPYYIFDILVITMQM